MLVGGLVGGGIVVLMRGSVVAGLAVGIVVVAEVVTTELGSKMVWLELVLAAWVAGDSVPKGRSSQELQEGQKESTLSAPFCQTVVPHVSVSQH
jgi:hypothetical protein